MPTGGNYQDQTNFNGEWHLYVAHTFDGGKSWVTSDATPTTRSSVVQSAPVAPPEAKIETCLTSWM
ncbi:MAG: hypothetical protein M3R24_00310 [Chloroflexota bacterium]|nr:hypothetical protein [Chloroflexota bacterium]PLS78868.1 MAG: hypothetical protein CYG59_16240 [Chloroflexota bacterium]